LRLAGQAAQRMGTGVQLWVAPSASLRFFRALHRSAGAGDALQWHEQPGGDLGARMAHAFATHFSAHPGLPLLLIGTDCPPLAPGHLLAAAGALEQHDAVLIPAEDGGYVLIGLRRPCPAVFEGVAWSTGGVLAQTRDRLRDAGLRWHELPTLWDVDTPDDWARLQRALQGRGA
ncbi:MAG: TIGR04282 family arsenosugar biosynthesis glycosyltransferase, partial [Burkholderiaceae bacterium]